MSPTAVLCPPDNTVSGSISPKWITRSTLSVTSILTYCVSVTFLLCNGCSWLKLCGRRSHTPIILLPHRPGLVRWLTKPPWRNVGRVQLCHLRSMSHQPRTSPPHFTRLPPPRRVTSISHHRFLIVTSNSPVGALHHVLEPRNTKVQTQHFNLR